MASMLLDVAKGVALTVAPPSTSEEDQHEVSEQVQNELMEDVGDAASSYIVRWGEQDVVKILRINDQLIRVVNGKPTGKVDPENAPPLPMKQRQTDACSPPSALPPKKTSGNGPPPQQRRNSVSRSAPQQRRNSVSNNAPQQTRNSVSNNAPQQRRNNATRSAPQQRRNSVSRRPSLSKKSAKVESPPNLPPKMNQTNDSEFDDFMPIEDIIPATRARAYSAQTRPSPAPPQQKRSSSFSAGQKKGGGLQSQRYMASSGKSPTVSTPPALPRRNDYQSVIAERTNPSAKNQSQGMRPWRSASASNGVSRTPSSPQQQQRSSSFSNGVRQPRYVSSPTSQRSKGPALPPRNWTPTREDTDYQEIDDSLPKQHSKQTRPISQDSGVGSPTAVRKNQSQGMRTSRTSSTASTCSMRSVRRDSGVSLAESGYLAPVGCRRESTRSTKAEDPAYGDYQEIDDALPDRSSPSRGGKVFNVALTTGLKDIKQTRPISRDSGVSLAESGYLTPVGRRSSGIVDEAGYLIPSEARGGGVTTASPAVLRRTKSSSLNRVTSVIGGDVLIGPLGEQQKVHHPTYGNGMILSGRNGPKSSSPTYGNGGGSVYMAMDGVGPKSSSPTYGNGGGSVYMPMNGVGPKSSDDAVYMPMDGVGQKSSSPTYGNGMILRGGGSSPVKVTSRTRTPAASVVPGKSDDGGESTTADYVHMKDESTSPTYSNALETKTLSARPRAPSISGADGGYLDMRGVARLRKSQDTASPGRGSPNKRSSNPFPELEDAHMKNIAEFNQKVTLAKEKLVGVEKSLKGSQGPAKPAAKRRTLKQLMSSLGHWISRR